MEETAHSTFVTIGASNHSKTEREINDYYATDPKAMELLLNEEEFDTNIWECACGGGHLSRVLSNRGYHVLSTDLVDRGYGTPGVDFLEQKSIFDGDIITNPPFKYAKMFVEHALDLIRDGHKVAMFLRLQFLEGRARRELFDQAPPQDDICCQRKNQLRTRRRLRKLHRRGAGLRMVCVGKGI